MRTVKSGTSARNKLKKILIDQGFRCLRCKTKMIRVAALKKYRTIIGRNPKHRVRWLMPCGIEMSARTASVDHITPRSVGGTNAIENLQGLCVKCNGNKEREETSHLRKRVNGVCRKCGAKARRAKCDACRLEDRAVVNFKNKEQRPLKRSVHIDGNEWSWQHGKDGVLIGNPELTQRWLVRNCVLLNVSPYELERAGWKHTASANVTPGVVKEYIERVIIKGEPPSLNLFIMRGIPGAGKTTTAHQKLKDYAHYYGLGELNPEEHIFSADQYFYKVVNADLPERYSFLPSHIPAAHKWCYLQSQNAFMAHKSPIIIDNLNTRPANVKLYYTLALAHGYKAEFLYPQNDLFQQFEEAKDFGEKDTLRALSRQFAERTGEKRVLAWRIERYMQNWVPRSQFTFELVMESNPSDD